MMKKNVYKFGAFLLVIAIIVLLVKRYHLFAYLNLEGFNLYRQQILAFEQTHRIEFTVGYIISYVVLIAACIPGTILFDLLAGFIFGSIIGSFMVIFSYLFGAVLNFLLVKFLFKDLLTHKFGHLRHVVAKDDNLKSAAINLIGLRFIPVIPFWLLNILAAILDIPLKLFVLTTFIGIIPTSIIYVLIGSGVREELSLDKPLTMDVISNPKLWIPLIALGLIILIPNIVRNIRKRRHLKKLRGE